MEGNIRVRKMFGEYALYCDEKVVALVCDDKLYVKPTDVGKSMLEKVDEQPPYPGAKLYFHISADLWENHEWLSKLIESTAAALPLPKPKKRK
jgi:TfoX/Sxy family transcriptional regulator of competence genes